MKAAHLGLLLALASCQAPAPDGAAQAPAPVPFRFETTGADGVSVSIRDQAGPVPHARVVIREDHGVGDDGVSAPGGVLFEGLTGADGACRGRLVRPLELGRLQVSIHHPEYEGRHDDPARRDNLGPFAPAAWFSVEPAELAALSVDLHRKGVSP